MVGGVVLGAAAAAAVVGVAAEEEEDLVVMFHRVADHRDRHSRKVLPGVHVAWRAP